MVQGKLWAILHDLASGRGDVGTEWRCYLTQEERRTSLVPDVAFVSRERLATLSYEERERPHFAPDIAVEVRSPDESRRIREWKIALYLRCGGTLRKAIPVNGSASKATSGTLRPAFIVPSTPFCQEGKAKPLETPPPLPLQPIS